MPVGVLEVAGVNVSKPSGDVGKAGGASASSVLMQVPRVARENGFDDVLVATKPQKLGYEQGISTMHIWSAEKKRGLSYHDWNILIVDVRDPIERMHSAWAYQQSNGDKVYDSKARRTLHDCFPAHMGVPQSELGHKPAAFNAFAEALDPSNDSNCSTL